jgi:hypothetical protein
MFVAFFRVPSHDFKCQSLEVLEAQAVLEVLEIIAVLAVRGVRVV